MIVNGAHFQQLSCTVHCTVYGFACDTMTQWNFTNIMVANIIWETKEEEEIFEFTWPFEYYKKNKGFMFGELMQT